MYNVCPFDLTVFFFLFFQDPDLQRLQKENAHLKEQLTKSMLVLVSSGKINVGSVDRGDIVMVVWNEDHNNFSIYTEPCFDLPLHFLHNESTHLLGLTIPPNNASKRYVLFHQKSCSPDPTRNLNFHQFFF